MSRLVIDSARAAYLAGDHREAIRLARSVQKREPQNRDAFRLLGLAYMGLQKWGKALEVMHRGWEAHPGDDILAANLAALYWSLGQDELAMKWILRAPPTFATIYTRSLLLLKYGDYERGWRDYDLRFELGESKLLQPRETMWDGRRLSPDDTLTIWSEQGVGDVVQFSRFIPLAKERAACKVKFAVSVETKRLFDGFPGVDQLTTVVNGTHIPILSLPRVLGIRLEDVSGKPYLDCGTSNCGLRISDCGLTETTADSTAGCRPSDCGLEETAVGSELGIGASGFDDSELRSADCGIVEAADSELRTPDSEYEEQADGSLFDSAIRAPQSEDRLNDRFPNSEISIPQSLRVGLCWSSNKSSWEFVDRYVPSRFLQAIRDLEPRIECRCLQYGEVGFEPIDFYETAQAIAECDLAITIDTSIAHIAGAMGIPTWVMLRYQGCYRWLREREDSPWYDSVKLYRQPNMGNWQHVIDRVVHDLKELING
jgi:tetratricopeptide (TPR) repeat protein